MSPPVPAESKNPAKVRAGQTGQRPSKLAFRIADQWPELDAHERQLVLEIVRRRDRAEDGGRGRQGVRGLGRPKGDRS